MDGPAAKHDQVRLDGRTVRVCEPDTNRRTVRSLWLRRQLSGQYGPLRGADGRSVTGRAILDFGGTYPSIFETRTDRRLVSGDTTFYVHEMFAVSAGARFEQERGYDDPDLEPTAIATTAASSSRDAVRSGIVTTSTLVSATSTTRSSNGRHAAPVGASYLRLPSASAVGDTKITLNAGTGIKAPSVFQSNNSVFALVQGTSSRRMCLLSAPSAARA